MREVLRAEGIDFGEFKETFPGQLADEDKIRRVHAAANPYIPKSLRIDWVVAAGEIRDRLLPLL